MKVICNKYNRCGYKTCIYGKPHEDGTHFSCPRNYKFYVEKPLTIKFYSIDSIPSEDSLLFESVESPEREPVFLMECRKIIKEEGN